MYAVEMRGIVKQYPLVRAVDGADFVVERGEIHSLLGENGAGKSTLMKILYGMTPPTAGTIRVFGKDVTISRPAQAISLGIGMVHQHFMLTPVMTVAENVVIGSEPVRGIFFDKKQAEAKVAAPALGLSPEGLVGVRERRRAKARPVVCHGELERAVCPREREAHLPARVAGRVGHEVVRDAREGARVRPHELGQPLAGRCEQPAVRADDLGGVGARGTEPGARVQGSGLDPCLLERVEPSHGLGKVREAIGLSRDGRSGGAHLLPLGGAPDELRLAAHHGERRAQVVREGGVDLAAALRRAPELLLGALGLCAHGLELAAEPPERVLVS